MDKQSKLFKYDVIHNQRLVKWINSPEILQNLSCAFIAKETFSYLTKFSYNKRNYAGEITQTAIYALIITTIDFFFGVIFNQCSNE